MKKSLKFPFLVALLLASLSPSNNAQQPSCNSPKNNAEQTECAGQELTAAEADLKQVLADILRQYSEATEKGDTALPKSEEREQSHYDSKMRRTLMVSQRAWVQYRAAACMSVAEMYDGGTITTQAALSCQAALTRDRSKFLRDNFGEK